VGWIPPNSRWLLVGGFEKCGDASRAAGMRPVVWRTPSFSEQGGSRTPLLQRDVVIAAFSLGLQFVQDWLGVWMESRSTLLGCDLHVGSDDFDLACSYLAKDRHFLESGLSGGAPADSSVSSGRSHPLPILV
jgi:hypothetical protein